MININKYIIEKLHLNKDTQSESDLELLYTARYISWLFDLITDDFNEESIKKFKKECIEGSGLISAIYKWVCENDVDRNSDYFTPICFNPERIREQAIRHKFVQHNKMIHDAVIAIGKSKNLLAESGTIQLFADDKRLLAYYKNGNDHRMIYLGK